MKFRFGSSKTSPYVLVAALVVSSLAAVAGSQQLSRRHAGGPAKQQARNTALAQMAQVPLSFEANRGQVRGKADFISRGPGFNLYVNPRGATMLFSESARQAATKHRQARGAGLVMKLLGSSKTAHAAPAEAQVKRTNYLIGNDPAKWRRNVPNFGKVRYASVYPGVDVVYYGNQRQLEYDFVVKPGADPKAIRLGFAGARDMQVDAKGDLVLKTAIGEVRQHRPVVYQNVNGVRKPVDGQYVARGKREVGFQVAKYDAAEPLIIDPVITWSTYIGGSLDDIAMGLVADAAGNSYVCGYTESFDEAADTAPGGIDAAPKYGNKVAKVGFPTTGVYFPTVGVDTGPTQTDDLDVNGSQEFVFTVTTYHAFVFKMNPNGNGLVFSTFLGSAVQNDYATALALDKNNNVYITGETLGSSFPRVRPLQAFNGGGGDAFVVKLSSDGTTPLFSSYLGGNGVDVGRAIAVDLDGNAVVTGLTTSSNLPVFNAVQPTRPSAARHQWVANINIGGNALNYLTYLGGTNGQEGGDQLTENPNTLYSGSSITTTIAPTSQTPKTHIVKFYGVDAVLFAQDYASGVAVDALGNAYVTGATTSTTFPTTANVYRNTKTTNDQDIFLTKFSPFGQVVYSTYAGGSGDDAGRSIALDAQNNAYITGYTNSPNLLTGTSGGFQTTYHNTGTHDAFVLKFNADASALSYGTYLGGSGEDVANDIAVNASGYAYVVGYTSSSDLPILNPVQGNLNAGSQDAFLVKLTPTGSGVEYLTYLGGGGTEWGMGVGVDATDAALVAGTTQSFNYPVTLGAYQGGHRTILGAGDFFADVIPVADVFVTRITNPPVAPSNLRITFVSTTEIDLAWDDNAVNETGFEIERSLDGVNFSLIGAVGTDTLTYQDKGLISNTRYYYRVRAVNSQGNSAYSNIVNIVTLPSPPAVPSKITAGALDQTRIQVQVTDGANNESNIILERSFDGVNFTTLQTFAAQAGTGAVINYIDGDPGTTPLTPNTKYFYRAKSTNTAGDSAYTSIVNATTLPAAPTVAPTGLTATPISSSEIDLSWTYPVSPTDAIGFKIYRGPDATNLSLYRVTTTPATTFADTGLPGVTTYFYKVAAYNASGDGPLSGVASAKTLPAPPADPNGLTATVGLGPVINLQWTDNSNNETDFLIERSTDGGATWPTKVFYVPLLNGNPIPFSQTGVRTYQDTTVTSDNTYTYRVTADITVGPNHSLSRPTNTVTQATPPAAPAMVSVQGVNSSTVLVTFTDQSKSETAFTLQRSLNGGAFTTVSSTIAAVAGNPNTVTFLDTNAQAEVTNTYRVFATNGAGSSPNSGTLTVTPLAAPSNVVFTPTGQTTANISFKDNSGFESGFKAERSTDGTNWTAVSATIGASTGTGATVTFGDTGLQANTQYTYRVWAFSANAESDRSNGTGTTLPNPPALPSGLTVAPGTQTTLNITFTDNSDNETGFVVERATTANGTYAGIAGSPLAASAGTGNVITLTDTGLSANTTYFYRVKAVNAGGDLGFVGPVSGTTLPNPPAAPTGLSAVLTGPTTATLTFTDNANNETGFVLERSTDGGLTFPTQLAPVPAKVPSGVVTVVDSGLSNDATYTYRVKATNTGGDSSTTKSNDVMTAPAAPANLTFTSITNNQIRLFWVNNSSTATSFKVERSLDGINFQPLTTVSAPTVSYLDTGLSGATTYTYRVRATNGGPFDSDNSPAASATTLPNPAGAPTNLQLAVKSQTQIDVTFVDASANEDGFVVQRSTDGKNWVPVGNNLPASPGTGLTITVHDSGLTANTDYSYRVQAFNAGGSSAFVTAGPVTTFPVPPGSPNNLTVSTVPGSSSQLLVQWKDGSNNETGFVLERATGNSNAFTTVSSSIGASSGVGNGLSFTDSGLTANTRYTYRVSAVNQGGSSQPSATASGLTLPGAPGGVTAAANATSTGIVVRWNAPTGGADGYSVEMKTDQPNDQGFHQVFPAGSSDRSFTFVQLIPNVTFTFRVLATNASGSSAPSNEASAKIAGGLATLTLSSTSVKGGKAVKGTVTIVGNAPAGGASIGLTTDNTSVTLPKSVVVPAGASSVTFNLTTKKVKKAATATISANYGGISKTATLKLKK